MSWCWVSPKAKFLIFAILVGVVFFVLLDLVGIHPPYISRYLLVIVAVILYVLFSKLAEKLGHRKIW